MYVLNHLISLSCFFFFLSSMASIFLIFVLSLLLFYPFLCFSYEARNHEVEALIAIRRSLDDPKGALSNWDEDSVDPCSWAMISCSSENLVIALGAPSQGLSGVLSGMISNLTNLKQVYCKTTIFLGIFQES